MKAPMFNMQGVTTGRTVSNPNCRNVEKVDSLIRDFLYPPESTTRFVEIDFTEVEKKLRREYGSQA